NFAHLPDLLAKIKKQYAKLVPSKMLGMVKQESRWRAEYAVRTAIMVRHGYPINVQWARNLSDSIPALIREACEDINKQFPERKPFSWNKKYNAYSLNTNVCKEYIREQEHLVGRWKRTDS